MEQFIVDSIMRAFSDPRLQDLVTEFNDMRPRVTLHNEDRLRSAFRHLIATVRTVNDDQSALRAMQPAEVPGVPDPDDVGQALCLAETLLDGPMFRDAMIILFVLQGRILGSDEPKPPADNTERENYLRPIDRFLSVLGVPEHVSLLSVWKQAEDLGDQREALFDAIETLIRAVRNEVRVSESPR
jgi:hypothetical protein